MRYDNGKSSHGSVAGLSVVSRRINDIRDDIEDQDIRIIQKLRREKK